MKIYEDMDLDSIVDYINRELLNGRTMKDIEENDFGVNERVITKRLGRKKIKKIDGQFVLQSGYKLPEKEKPKNVSTVNVQKKSSLIDNNEFLELKNQVNFLEDTVNQIIRLQKGSDLVTNNLGLKIYSTNNKPIAKTIRLYKEVWDKIDRVKETLPHINYQVLLNSLIDEITEKYLADKN